MSFRNLKAERELRVYTPDVTMEDAKKGRPYVLKIPVPKYSEFVEVLQIEHPLKGLAGMGMGMMGALQGSTLGYAFMVWRDVEEIVPWYVTAVSSNKPIPWQCRRLPGIGWNDAVGSIICSVMGMSVHSGVPLVHVKTSIHERMDDEDDEAFEQQLQEFGWLVLPVKIYDSRGLLGMVQKHVQQGQGAMAPEGAEGAPTKKED